MKALWHSEGSGEDPSLPLPTTAIRVGSQRVCCRAGGRSGGGSGAKQINM